MKRLVIGFLFLVTLISPASVYAEKQISVRDSTPLDVQQYRELGKFDVPREMSLSIVKLNGKTYILSSTPDRRLYALNLGKTEDGRDVLCGTIKGSLKVKACYFVLYREK